jgi:hypothetical protein
MIDSRQPATGAMASMRQLLPLAWVLAASAIVWAFLFALFPPSQQNFPLGDDWAFIRGFLAWSKGQGIHYLKWASMPELGQWVWAFPWTWAGGDHIVILRLSTIVLSWLGLLAFYDLLQQYRVPAGRAAFTVACMAFSPLFFLLEGTFMTDVPALSFSLIALAFYERALRDRKLATLTAATVVGLLAVTTRQNAIAVPLAAGILLSRDHMLRRCFTWWAMLALLVLVGIGLYAWFQSRRDILPVAPTWKPILVYFLTPFILVHYLGLAVLPMLLLKPRPRSWLAFAMGTILVAIAVAVWRSNLEVEGMRPFMPTYDLMGLFPFSIPILGPYGPFAGQFILGNGPLLADWNLRLGLTILGCFTGGMLLARLDTFEKRARWNGLVWFSLLQVPIILTAPKFYDRYFLFLLPGVLYATALVPTPTWGLRLVASATLVLSGALSLALMHDWLEWNRARWAVGRSAVGIHPWQIEGGLEWDGWFAPGPGAPEPPEGLAKNSNIRLVSSYDFHFWHVIGDYGLGFKIPEGAHAIRTAPFHLWLVPGQREFYLVQYED